MKLLTRLWLYGALLPAGLLVAALIAAGIGLDHLLRQETDRALLAQATIESVSLFDRLSGAHLHQNLSPLRDEAGATAWAALYGPDGRLAVQAPAQAQVPARIDARAVTPTPRLVDAPGPGGAGQRVLLVRVPGPDGQPWTLRLAQSLHAQAATLRAYTQVAVLVGLLTLAGLLAVQLRFGHRLHGRIDRLAQHMRRLRAGQLDRPADPDPTRDVLGELRDLAEQATAQLRRSRDDQQRLLADAAHELRTPLAVLQTDVDVTLRKPRSPGELQQALLRVRAEVQRLGKLATSLLDLAAIRRADRERLLCDLEVLVSEAVRAWSNPAAERGLHLACSGPSALTGHVDPAAIRQVLDNLLSNAMDFAPHGTQIDVAWGARDDHLWLSVRDRGPGVAEAEREAIFSPFCRADRHREGAGLGLAIVHDVAMRHGGRAYVEEPPDGGARFVVQLSGGERPDDPPGAGQPAR